MEFQAHVKSVTSNIAKKEITISFVMALNDENLETAVEAAEYTEEDAGPVVLQILPQQMKMKLTPPVETGSEKG